MPSVFEKRGGWWGSFTDPLTGKRKKLFSNAAVIAKAVAEHKLDEYLRARKREGDRRPWFTVIGVDANGEIALQSVLAKTPAEAAEGVETHGLQALHVLGGKQASVFSPTTSLKQIRLDELIDAYKADYVLAGGKELVEVRTRNFRKEKAAREILVRYLTEHEKLTFLSEVRSPHLARFKVWRGPQVKARTANASLRVGSAMWNWAKTREHVRGENPFAKVKHIRVVQKSPEVLPMLQVRRLLVAIQDHRLMPLVATAALAGLRNRELRFLEVEDIDLTERVIYLDNDKDFVTKSRKCRQVPIVFDDLVEILRTHLPKEGLCFRSARGGAIEEANMHRSLRKLAQETEIPFTLQKLRRSWVTMLTKDLGIPMALVQQWAGHASIETTQKHYVGSKVGAAPKHSLGVRKAAAKAAVDAAAENADDAPAKTPSKPTQMPRRKTRGDAAKTRTRRRKRRAQG